jgi:hypothetical protein
VTTDATYGNEASFNIDDVSLTVATTADIPSNDNFTNAALITSDSLTNTVLTTYASKEAGEPNIAGNEGGHSLWWTWTAPRIGTVTIATTGSSFNTLLGVFTGSSITNLTVVTNSDGVNRSTGLAYVKFNVTQGTTYDFALAGYNDQSGTANFIFNYAADKTRPTVTIKSPTNGVDVTGSTIQVSGTASDNVAVASVYYELVNAAGTNGWNLATGTTNWSVALTNLVPGRNVLYMEAYDTSTNISTPVSCVINYIVPVPLTLTIIGKGTVSGATNGQSLHLGYAYKLTATPGAGFAFKSWTGDLSTNKPTLSFTVESALSLTATFVDLQKPVLTITAPKTGQRWSNAVFNVTGKAGDNVGVETVWLQVDGGTWTSAVSTDNRYTNWNADVTLNPGANAIKAYAQDAAGNKSLTNAVSFTYILSASLAVQTNGQGTVKPNYNNTLLQINNIYTMDATPAKGFVFSNWTTSAGVPITNGPNLKFTMASNLIFVANFVPNPFTSAAGTYQGLFYDNNNVMPAGSGFFNAQVASSGSFTAKFEQGNTTHSVAGQFSLTGLWSTNGLKTWGDTAIILQLNLTGGNTLSGELTNPAWGAQLMANRAVFTVASPAQQAGKYTLVLPGANSPMLPGGNGFGTVTVSPIGGVAFNGTFGDGTKVTTATAFESESGLWPFYYPLDGGNGMIIGWLTFTNESDRDIDGQLSWFKPAQTSAATYKAGFTNEIEAVGSAYSFKSGEQVLNLTDGYVLLENGDLAQSISNQFTLASDNVATGTGLHLTITPSTGLFSGTVANSGGKPISVSGAVLQKQTNGFGLFLNNAQSGSVYLAPW